MPAALNLNKKKSNANSPQKRNSQKILPILGKLLLFSITV